MDSTRLVNPIGGGKRLDYNDLAKAFGMLAIIWGHIRLTGWSNAFVYAWHIPLFFFLSGMVFNKCKYADFRTFFMKKVKSLLVPYVIYSFLTWFVWAAFSLVTHAQVDSYWMPLAQTFIAQGSGGFLVHNVPLWFVTCLFVMEVIYYFLSDFKKVWILIVSIALASVSYYMITYVDVVDITLLPWNLEVACLGLPFFAIGHLIVQKFGHQQMQNWVDSHRVVALISCMLLGSLVFIGSSCNGSISFGHADIHNPLITYPCALAGIAMMLLFCMLLAGTESCRNDAKWMHWIKWFGRNSFTAMAIHNPIKGFVCVIVGVLLGCGSAAVSNNGSYSVVAFVLTLTITIVGISLVNWVKTVYNKLVMK